MWIGAIRLRVTTKDAPNGGTDSLVQTAIRRDGVEIKRLNLDFPDENDLERGAVRNYTYSGPTKLQRNNDQTPELPDGIGQIPMPYPSFGLEFSNGLPGHLTVRLIINGDDMWIKDEVHMDIRQIRLVATSFDTEDWQEDNFWTHVATWSADVAMSSDSDEGVHTWNMVP